MDGKTLVSLMLSGSILLCNLGVASGVTLLTQKEALKLMLPDAEEVIKEIKTLTPAQKQMIKAIWKWKVEEDTYTFYVGESKGETTGTAFIIDQPGKHAPLLIVIGIEPDGKVRDVAIMDIREQRGKPVKERFFLKQFIGKTSKDPLSVGKDIDAVTKATTSCRAAAIAVKKAVVLYDVFYLRTAEKLGTEEAAQK